MAHRPPGALDSASHALIGHGALIAWLLTWTLYLQWLAPLGIVLIVVAIAFPRWRVRVALTLIVLLVMWFASDQLQHLFGRPRRMDWIVKHETAMSFPSGHATLAVAFYGLWAYLLGKSPDLGAWVRTIGCAVLIALVLAVCWSRLALGAHYPSDVLGGILLGLSGAGAAIGLCAWLKVPLYAGFFGD